MAKVRITLVKSPIGSREDQKATVRALGLRHLGATVEREDTAAIRGMVRKVRHLVEVKESGTRDEDRGAHERA